ncbi:unnamed protein product [Echinostoma caproni]|uniref:Uncharacterized protein n=1 Tax=Echinostoma caproni TaxID=27848 RepID=A0A183ATU6_9TREM|nr:unnamed protein product [Echinostoma caproni]
MDGIKKTVDSQPTENVKVKEETSEVVDANPPPVVERRPTSRRIYFRRPPRNSDISKSIPSKMELASGWEQKSTNISIQECHEAFIKAFAIPTHLYRYLAQRHRQRPLFLDRTLSYLRSPPSVIQAAPPKRPPALLIKADFITS